MWKREKRKAACGYRVDGLLQKVKTFDLEQHAAILARIKILARLDITEMRCHRTVISVSSIRTRLSTSAFLPSPGIFGEKAVLKAAGLTKALRRLSGSCSFPRPI